MNYRFSLQITAFFYFLLIASFLHALPRDLSTDRPDKTESPYTVDSGYFQIEMDFLTFSSDESYGLRERELGIIPVNIKYGLSDSTDLQLVFGGYTEQSSSSLNTSSTHRNYGAGDMSLRLKYNVFGNDEGHSSLALMPYLKLPTATGNIGNDAYEGGLIIPYGIELGSIFGLGLMSQLDVVRDRDNAGNHAAFINSVTISSDLNEIVGIYVEYYTEQHMQENTEFIATADFGCTLALDTYQQLDFGVNFGVTEAADDINPFLGFSQKFN